MNTTMIVIVVAAVAILLVAAGLAWYFIRRMRAARLRQHFGPEYDRAVQELGNENKAISELAERQKKVAALDIRPLSAAERDHYLEEWRRIQAGFVDNPPQSIAAADRLIQEVMKARAYPVADFEEQAAYLSVDHPQVVSNYRAAHEIASRDGQQPADTEELRRAMIYYRSLFEDLLETNEGEGKTEPAEQKPEVQEVVK